MTERLVKPHIKYISILTDDTMPANGKPVLIKSLNAKYKEVAKATVTKNDTIKGEMYFVAVIGKDTPDSDDQIYENEDTVFTQRDVMKGLQTAYGLADVNHDMVVRDKIWLAESTLTDGNGLMVKGEYDKFEKIAFEGAYNYSEDEKMMQKAKDGKITGVSIFGYVEDVIPAEKSKSEDENLFRKFMNFVTGKAETERNYAEDSITGKLYSATRSFQDSIIGWDNNTGEYLKISTQSEYLENVEDLNKILKEINIEITKEETDMERKEFDEYIKTDEGLKALEESKYTKAEDGNTTDTTDGNTDTGSTEGDDTGSTENEELEKAQKEVIEKDEKITELEKQVEEITKKFDILDKAKAVVANKDAELKDIEKEITLETWERMDRGDRYNFKIQYPELNKKYEES